MTGVERPCHEVAPTLVACTWYGHPGGVQVPEVALVTVPAPISSELVSSVPLLVHVWPPFVVSHNELAPKTYPVLASANRIPRTQATVVEHAGEPGASR
jgi:hypothetical protein